MKTEQGPFGITIRSKNVILEEYRKNLAIVLFRNRRINQTRLSRIELVTSGKKNIIMEKRCKYIEKWRECYCNLYLNELSIAGLDDATMAFFERLELEQTIKPLSQPKQPKRGRL